MAGYCGLCNQHYDCHYTDHEFDCPETEVTNFSSNPIDDFEREKEQQGWSDDMDEEIWNKHFRD